LGSLGDQRINDARTVISQFSHPAITLQLTTLARFPDDQSKIITALPTASQGLKSLQTKLQLSLEDKGFPPLTRPFRPHISLTRIKDTNDNLPLRIIPTIDFPVLKIVLYKSEMIGKDSLYKMIEQQTLAPKQPEQKH
jgi:2'-5' RNA ligase